jgi:tryptophan synthase beta subunit
MCKFAVKGVVFVMLILGCASMKTGEKMSQFDETSRAYIRAIRWGDYEGAYAFKKLTDREGVLPDFEDYRAVKVTNYKVKQTIISEDQTKIIQIVDFQYYRLTDVTVKTLIDRQKWEYDEEQGRWLLQSNLPAF